MYSHADIWLVREAVASEANDSLRVEVGGANEASYVRDINSMSNALTFYIHV